MSPGIIRERQTNAAAFRGRARDVRKNSGLPANSGGIRGAAPNPSTTKTKLSTHHPMRLRRELLSGSFKAEETN